MPKICLLHRHFAVESVPDPLSFQALASKQGCRLAYYDESCSITGNDTACINGGALLTCNTTTNKCECNSPYSQVTNYLTTNHTSLMMGVIVSTGCVSACVCLLPLSQTIDMSNKHIGGFMPLGPICHCEPPLVTFRRPFVHYFNPIFQRLV